MAFSSFALLSLCSSASAESYEAEVSHNSRRSLFLSSEEKRGEHGQGQPQLQRVGHPPAFRRHSRTHRGRGRYSRRPRRVGGVPQQGQDRCHHRAVRAGLSCGLRPPPRHRHRRATLGGQGHGTRRERPRRLAGEGADVHHRRGARRHRRGELYNLGLLAQGRALARCLLPLCATWERGGSRVRRFRIQRL